MMVNANSERGKRRLLSVSTISLTFEILEICDSSRDRSYLAVQICWLHQPLDAKFKVFKPAF